MDVTHRRRGALRDPAVESFVDFYRHEWRNVVGLGFVLTGNRCVAEDLAQEGFAAAYRRWDRVAGMDKPGAWVIDVDDDKLEAVKALLGTATLKATVNAALDEVLALAHRRQALLA